jgi:polyhydroxyalkanoate synthase
MLIWSISLRASCWTCFSPGNNLTNPEVLRVSIEQRGNNLLIGLQNCMNDMVICCWNSRPADRSFLPGKDVAITPGKVVLRNHIMELIQYARPARRSIRSRC